MTNNVCDVKKKSIKLKSSALFFKEKNAGFPCFSFDIPERLNAIVNNIEYLKYTLDFFFV